MIARARVAETTRHAGMPHYESSALLEFRDLRGFEILAGVPGLDAKIL